MNEKLEIVKSELNTTTEIKDIWENPVVKFLSQFIPISKGIDSAIGKAFEIHQKKKQEQLFEIILEDDTITIDDVNDVDCIMEFAKTMEVVNRLIRNDKIKYLAFLLKNSIKDKKRNIDEFEELLSKFSTLSVREIELLNLLYETENESMIKDNNGQMVFNINESWKAFMNKAKSLYELNESEITSKMLGIMRTGFCICEWKTNLSDTGIVVYTAPEYRNMLSKIQ